MSDPMTTPPARGLARLGQQLSRDKADTLLLIGATLLVLAPHAPYLPLWVSALCATTLGWRALITFRGTRMPPGYVLLPLAMAAMGGVFLTFKTLLGREAGVAMVVMLLAFKMLEMHARRDLFVVIFLSFFLVMTGFFHSQSIGAGAMMVAAIVALLAAQLSFQYTGRVPPLKVRLLLAGKIVALAAPLAILLFLLFPRIEGPLWGMPGDAANGRSGLSGSMAPGNIADLAQSSEIAFRARFEGAPPAQALRYWRGLVLDEFDGRTWTQAPRSWRMASGGLLKERAQPYSYQVTLEPHGERWLFALDMLGSAEGMKERGVTLTPEYELRSLTRISQRMRYDIESNLSYRLEGGPELASSARYLALPAGFNPRTLEAGRELRREPDPAVRVQTVLAMFRREPFSYTLQPPLLGRHTVDDFLYRTRAGFCEHYANAFVVLMRAAGVPARVVAGYQGGELNPVDNFVVVRQSDAHAWTEVWLGARGWVRVDPTAAVAPDRVARNLARALPPEPTFANLISIELSENNWLAKIRFRLSAINNGWNQWVLNYDGERRSSFLGGLMDAFGNWRTLAGLLLVAGMLWVARTLQLRARRDPIDALYSALCQQLGRLGMVRADDEGPNAYAARIAALPLAPARKAAVLQFLQLYSAHKYGPQAPDGALAATLKKLLNTAP